LDKLNHPNVRDVEERYPLRARENRWKIISHILIEGDEIKLGEAFGTIEAVKAVEDMLSPLSGEIVAINETLEDEPELINKSVYEDGWIVRIKLSDTSEIDNLMDSKQYEGHIED